MTTREERQVIGALHRASNGSANLSHDSSKKRSREDDASAGETSRRRTGIRGPFTGIGQSNLQERRANDARTLKRDHGSTIKLTDNRSNKYEGSLSSKAFSSRTGLLDEPFGKVTHDGQPPSLSTQQSSPSVSKAINDKMDGASDNEATFSFSMMLEVASIPLDTPKRQERRTKQSETPTVGHTSSDLDPMDCIGGSGKTVNPIDNAFHQNNVDDDGDDGEIVACDPPAANRQGPNTSKELSIVKEGTVKDAVRKIESNPSASTIQSSGRSEPNLDRFLAPKSAELPSPLTKVTRGTLGKPAPSGPTSKGHPISIGSTRPKPVEGKISGRMQGKLTSTGKSQTSQLKIQSLGAFPLTEKRPQQRTKQRETKPYQSQFEFTFQIQEWYCDPKHYESNTNRDSYSLTASGSMLKIVFKEYSTITSKDFCIMEGDIERFEVVDTAEDESYLWMIIHLTSQLPAKRAWRRAGLGDSSVIFLHLFGSDDPDIRHLWKALIRRMAEWTKKDVIRKKAMDALVKDATDRSSEFTFHVPKIQDTNSPRQREPAIDSRARTMSPLSKPRTRSTASSSKPGDSANDPKSIVVEDLDEVVLVHPTGTGSVTINRGELARLEPGEFLNDTLIELGLKMWLNDLRHKDPNLVDQIHIFSSFFFKKLDAGPRKGCDYNSVKKWTSKFNLFSKKFIIIPINEHLHWYLAIICFPEHVLKAPIPQPSAQPSRVTRSSDTTAKAEQQTSGSDILDVDEISPVVMDADSPTEPGKLETDAELADQSGKMAIDSPTPAESQQDVVVVDPKSEGLPEVEMINADEDSDTTKADGSHKTWILILDSLGGKHARTVRILREYLQAEAQERYKKVVDIKDTRSSGGFVDDKHLSVPVQPNWCDCGVYLLHYVEAFYANPLEIIALPPGRKRKPKEVGSRYDELWKTDQVKEKRTAFREKLHELSTKWLESKASSPENTAPTPGTLPSSNNLILTTPPYLQTEASILEIDPSEATSMTRSAVAELPSSVSVLPPGLGYPSSAAGEEAPRRASSDDVAEVEGIVRSDQQSPIAERVAMVPGSSQSSLNIKPTRRGRKGGSKHGSKLDSESSFELNRGPGSSPEL
ncbi:Ulp1 protease family, C-terminal catalytic domain, partial [Rhizoctonia solani]